MAVTRKDELNKAPEYQQSQEVTDAQQKMQQYQNQQPAAYSPSQQVQSTQQTLNDVQANKPQGYNSKYGQALDNILQQIQNPKDFKYEFNGDEMFKYYADLYTQKGKQASMDAMGQAAALTGGYGNSYAQQVGNQAYDQYLLNLYDKGMDLYDRAYQRYQDQRADQYNQFGVLNQQDQIDYGRYRDLVGDWQNEREYATNRYDTERNFDYGKYRDAVSDYMNNRDYYTNVYNTERNFDYNQFADTRNFNEQVRQFDESLNWEKMSSDQKYAAEYCMQILANGQMPSEGLLMQAGLSAEDAQKMMAQLAAGGSGGRGGRTTQNDTGNNQQGMSYYDARSNIMTNMPTNITQQNGKTIADMIKDSTIDISRVGTNKNASAAQNAQAVANALAATNYAKEVKNSAKDYASKIVANNASQKAIQAVQTFKKRNK